MEESWKKFIIEQKELEEKVRLFDELIKIDGEEWRVMISDLDKKEREDERKRLKEMEREEMEDWDNAVKKVERKQKMDKIIEQMVFLLTNKKN